MFALKTYKQQHKQTYLTDRGNKINELGMYSLKKKL